MALGCRRWRERAASRTGPSSRAGSVRPMSPRSSCNATSSCCPTSAARISERYTSPLKLFEYLAAGRPIVASNLPALREVLTDGINAVLVEPGNAAALASAVERRWPAIPNWQIGWRAGLLPTRRCTAGTRARRGSNRCWSKRGGVRDLSGAPRARPMSGLSRRAAGRDRHRSSAGRAAAAASRAPATSISDRRSTFRRADEVSGRRAARGSSSRDRVAAAAAGGRAAADAAAVPAARARRPHRRSRMRQRTIARVEPRKRRDHGRHRRRAVFRRAGDRRRRLWCWATCAACRLRMAPSPRATRWTCSSTCRARPSARCSAKSGA